jgi:Ribosomal protein S2
MKFLSTLLSSLGIHIGTYNYLTNPESYKYLLGVRNEIAIFDLQQVYYQIRAVSSFLYELGTSGSFLLFFHSKVEELPIYFKLFLLNLISMQYRHGFVEQKWSYGQLSNATTQIQLLLTSLFYLDAIDTAENKVYYSLYDLLYRLLFFTIYKRLEGVSWLDTYNSVRKYWRFFYFFKCYSFSKLLPETLVYVNTSNFQVPTREADSQSIPVVLVGNNAVDLVASYVISSNTVSYVVSLFYLVLFLYSYNYGFFNILERIKHTKSDIQVFNSLLSLL